MAVSNGSRFVSSRRNRACVIGFRMTKVPRRADIDGVQVPELFREPGWPEGSVTADVDAAEENDLPRPQRATASIPCPPIGTVSTRLLNPAIIGRPFAIAAWTPGNDSDAL